MFYPYKKGGEKSLSHDKGRGEEHNKFGGSFVTRHLNF